MPPTGVEAARKAKKPLKMQLQKSKNEIKKFKSTKKIRYWTT